MKTIIELQKELSRLLDELQNYYTFELDENEDSKENRRIKKKLFQLICDASKTVETEFKEQVLMIIAENTGCQEDLQLLEEFLFPLVSCNVITQEEVNKYFSNLPVNRWF